MKPKTQPRYAFELFQSHFDQLLDPRHELILLANKIDSLHEPEVQCISKGKVHKRYESCKQACLLVRRLR